MTWNRLNLYAELQKQNLLRFTCSLFIAAIKGKMTGFNLLGNPDIHTTAEATKEETVMCKLFCRIISKDGKYV
jgi:hypothetical protein